MIVSARIFLILLFPLLLHGAQDPPRAPGGAAWLLSTEDANQPPHPYRAQGPPSAPGGDTRKWLLSAKEANQPPHLYQPSPESTSPGQPANPGQPDANPPPHQRLLASKPTSDRPPPEANQPPHLYQPFPESSPGQLANPGQPANANLPPPESPHSIQRPLVQGPNTNLHVLYCDLPPGTMVLSESPSRTWVAYTLQGDMVYISEGIPFIVRSSGRYHIGLPVGVPETQILGKDDPRAQAAGWFPQGTKYRRVDTMSLHNLEFSAHTGEDRVLTTEEGDMFYIRQGTTIIISNVPNYIRVPTTETNIRTLDNKDLLTQATAVFTAGTTYHYISSPQNIVNLRTTFHTRQDLVAITQLGYVFIPNACTVIVLRSNDPRRIRLPIGHTTIRIIGDDTYIFTTGTKYRILLDTSTHMLKTTTHTSSKQIAITVVGVVPIPPGSAILVSGWMRLPTGVKIIDQKSQNEVQERCRNDFTYDIPPNGMKKEPPSRYMHRCIDISLYRGVENRVKVPVEYEHIHA